MTRTRPRSHAQRRVNIIVNNNRPNVNRNQHRPNQHTNSSQHTINNSRLRRVKLNSANRRQSSRQVYHQLNRRQPGTLRRHFMGITSINIRQYVSIIRWSINRTRHMSLHRTLPKARFIMSNLPTSTHHTNRIKRHSNKPITNRRRVPRHVRRQVPRRNPQNLNVKCPLREHSDDT